MAVPPEVATSSRCPLRPLRLLEPASATKSSPTSPVYHRKRTRASKPKTKTGCRNCRSRRLKCDETRPGCSRCAKSQLSCEYPVALPRDAPRQLVPIGPKPIPATHFDLGNLLSLKSSRFLNQDEYRYFQVFCNNTASRVGGYFCEELFSRLILQACEDDQAIRYAAIAIAALDMTLESSAQLIGRRPFDTPNQRERYHKDALQLYGKAIKGMRDAVASGSQNIRKTMIGCLLAICFESFQGNVRGAVDQTRSGLQLIQEWQLKTMNQNDSWNFARNFSSLTPKGLEVEIVQAFLNLDTISLSVFDTACIVPLHPMLSQYGLGAFTSMPAIFSDLKEASAYFELAVRYGLHCVLPFCALSQVAGLWEGDRSKYPSQNQKMIYSKHPLPHETKSAWIGDIPALRERFNDYLTIMARWESAFDSVYTKVCSSTNQKDLIAAIDIKMRFICTYNAFSGAFQPETEYDALLPSYREAIVLVKKLISLITAKGTNPKAAASFIFYGPIIGSLYCIVLKCRDPAVRREAIALLKAQPRREGLWDSVLTAKLSELLVSVEEEGMVDGFIPECYRMRYVRARFDLQDRTAVMIFIRSEPLPGEQLMVEQIRFVW